MKLNRRCWFAMVATIWPAALLLSGCAGLGGPPSIKLSESELNARVQRIFPLQRRLLEVFEASVSAPRLRLLPERNRLAVVLDIALRDRVLGGNWQGRLDFDAALRWDAADQSVRLDQVRVQDFVLAPGSSGPRTTVERLGLLLAERALEGLSLYRLPPERAAELQRRGLAPGAIAVTERGVEITFVPIEH